jgi:ACT domain-containing protein
MDNTIEKRKSRNKEQILEFLKKTPIVQIACEKSGVSRASYYRWRKEDQEFAQASDQALLDGSLLVNDMAESQLMSAIKDKNMTGIIFWLKHHHPAYATRVEITATNKNQEINLTDEQKELLNKALEMAALVPPQKKDDE